MTSKTTAPPGKRKRPNITPEGHDKVASVARLINIYQIQCDAQRVSQDIGDNFRVQNRHKIEVIEEEPLGLEFIVSHNFGVRGIKAEPEGSTEVLFQIEANYHVSYELKTERRRGITKSDVASYAEINSIVHVWPFWREFVHNQTSRMNLPVILLNVKTPHKSLAKLIKERQNTAKSPPKKAKQRDKSQKSD